MKDNKKHILVISQFFYPEQFRINDMCMEWVKRGYKVTVLTGIPNYPQGRFYDGYGLKKKRKETWNGIEIIRIPLIPRGHGSIGLVLNYFSFPISGWFWNLFSDIKADLVFMFETSPFTQCKIGVWYAKKHKVPLYLYAQDLWPENVEVVTGIHSKLILNPIQRMVDKIYKACTKIFVTSPSFRQSVIDRNIPENKVVYWPQYAEEFYEPVEKRPISEVPEDNSFKIVFTGNIGYAQGLDILPKTAKILQNKDINNVKFVLVGEGRYLDQFKKDIAGAEESFVLIPRKPAVEIPYYLAACDAAFISFQNNELWNKTIPAKLQSYMACGMPIIASAAGETERIIKEAKCGICAPLGDAEKLADAIVSLMQMNLSAMQNNSRSFFLKHFNKKMLMDEMDEYLN